MCPAELQNPYANTSEHQSQCLTLGDSNPETSAKLTRQFIGQSKVFGHTAYVARSWGGALNGLASMQFMTTHEAVTAGVPIATEQETRNKIELLSCLAQDPIHDTIIHNPTYVIKPQL